MKAIFIFTVALLFGTVSYAQHHKYVYLEAGGSSVLAGVNFDMRLKKDTRQGFGVKAGIGNTLGLLDTKPVKDVVTIPVGLNYVCGANKSALVVGFNSTFIVSDRKSDPSVIFAPEIGYRYRPVNKGLSFHVSYTPLFNTVDGAMPLYGGVGIGYSWR